MKKHFRFVAFGIAVVFLSFSSCKKEYVGYDNMEVVENNFTGNMDITSVGTNPAGDFTGNDRSGTYSFAWVNNQKKASLNFDVTTSGGSVQVILNDARGREVLNSTRPEGGNDTFAGVSEEGKEGTWLVSLIFTNLNGDGSFSLQPGG